MRRALVTGAGSGIGYATALRLASDGYAVHLVDVHEQGLDRARRAIEETGGTSTQHALDVRDEAAVEAAVADLEQRYGNVHLLVNNAGVGVRADVIHTSKDDWDRMVGVNLTAVFLLCRAVLPGMLEAGRGVIVNVASVGGLVGLRERAGYCATKAGVIGLTRALAADHAAAGIRVNAICPGTVATEWIDKILADAPDPEATRKAMEQRQLDGRMGSPEEVAAGIAFLASDEGRFVNGSAFVMDGGVTAV